MLKFEIIGAYRIVARLGVLPAERRAAVADAVRASSALLLARAKSNASDGTPLHARSGRLAGAIASQVTDTATSIDGIVSVSGVPYARILEYGGVTSPHDILPVRAKALRFVAPGRMPIGKSGAGDVIFAKIVHHPGSRIPEYSYMRRALVQSRSEIVAMIRAAALGQSMSAAA